ncbi:hypothetical protein, partial [Bilophila wadsworthia]|uniref:hypothetical protein n=2 Tax=Bilophila wadsworthia TaxID=35833 RepID=UPI003AAD4403
LLVLLLLPQFCLCRFSWSLSQSQFIKIPYMARKTPPCRNMRGAPAQAGHRTSPSEGGKSIRAQAGSVRSGIACQMDSEFTKYRSSCTDGQVHLVFFFQERDFRRSNDQKARIILLPPAKPFSFSFAGGGGVCYKKGCGHSNLKRIKAASYENRPIRFFMHSTPLFF